MRRFVLGTCCAWEGVEAEGLVADTVVGTGLGAEVEAEVEVEMEVEDFVFFCRRSSVDGLDWGNFESPYESLMDFCATTHDSFPQSDCWYSQERPQGVFTFTPS